MKSRHLSRRGFLGTSLGSASLMVPSMLAGCAPNETKDEVQNGDQVELIITHCDPTVNLYDHYHCVRGDRLEAIWEITGRGKCQ